MELEAATPAAVVEPEEQPASLESVGLDVGLAEMGIADSHEENQVKVKQTSSSACEEMKSGRKEAPARAPGRVSAELQTGDDDSDSDCDCDDCKQMQDFGQFSGMGRGGPFRSHLGPFSGGPYGYGPFNPSGGPYGYGPFGGGYGGYGGPFGWQGQGMGPFSGPVGPYAPWARFGGMGGPFGGMGGPFGGCGPFGGPKGKRKMAQMSGPFGPGPNVMNAGDAGMNAKNKKFRKLHHQVAGAGHVRAKVNKEKLQRLMMKHPRLASHFVDFDFGEPKAHSTNLPDEQMDTQAGASAPSSEPQAQGPEPTSSTQVSSEAKDENPDNEDEGAEDTASQHPMPPPWIMHMIRMRQQQMGNFANRPHEHGHKHKKRHNVKGLKPDGATAMAQGVEDPGHGSADLSAAQHPHVEQHLKLRKRMMKKLLKQQMQHQWKQQQQQQQQQQQPQPQASASAPQMWTCEHCGGKNKRPDDTSSS